MYLVKVLRNKHIVYINNLKFVLNLLKQLL